MMSRPTSTPASRIASALRALRGGLRSQHAPGMVVLGLTLFVLAAGVGMQPDHRARLFLAGEVATTDVVADRNLQVEDPQATKARRDQLASMQPTAFDLSGAETARLRQRFFDIFRLVSGDASGPRPAGERDAATSADPSAPLSDEEILIRLRDLSDVSFGPEAVPLLAGPRLQTYMTEEGLPWLEARLREGVVSDARLLRTTGGGVLIRNMDTGQEIVRPSGSDIRDLVSLLNLFSQHLRASERLNRPEIRVVNQIAAALVMPTLTINREATQALGAMIAQNAEPVYYRISKGEVIVHRDERVTHEQQIKLQSLFRTGKTLLRAPETIGAFALGLFITIGLFVAPSGKPSSPMRRRDLYFIAFLLLFFGLAAKGLHVAGPRLLEGAALTALPFVFPVTAISGLAALIFASRRYCVTGLLASLYAALLFNGGIALFLFYFVSAMCNTWLVLRAQNRQDVVYGMAPLGAAVLPLGFAAALMEGFPLSACPPLALYLAISVVLAQFAMFAVSPLLEMCFGYTTRFRLMELLNLEQPLLQDLMVSAPGTYHHSLVVSNMVEAGAKAVGANSLLCKAGALYHDIGKLAYPDYFIENQFGGPNRHDRLAPAMSALILVSHVKKGVELARNHRLGDDIEDMIRQHHGTSIMRFFYQKAQEQTPGEALRTEDFQYPGPRPQTREAAIVLVADMVEASSRSLSDPTPARIKTHIDTTLKNIFADGHLDESALTFQDLHRLSESFVRILTGLFHQRIAYPDLNRKCPAPAESAARSAGNAPKNPAAGAARPPDSPACRNAP